MELTFDTSGIQGDRHAELAKIEEEFNIHLGDSYRQFLLQVNGGVPSRRRMTGLDGVVRTVSFFYSLGGRPVSTDLRYAIKMSRGLLAPETLPVATDRGGNIFALDTNERVVFVDHEIGDAGDSPVVADSFVALLDGLH